LLGELPDYVGEFSPIVRLFTFGQLFDIKQKPHLSGLITAFLFEKNVVKPGRGRPKK
jgi:hypothetical protein